MQHTNPVFQVLVTSTPGGNPATGQLVLAKGLKPDSLKGGQIGFFNAHTGLSIDSTSAAETIGDYYVMVGVNKGSANNASDDYQMSSGYYIQPRHTTALTLKGYMPETPKIVEVTNFTVNCDYDYCLKIEVRNQQSYLVNGYNGLINTYCYHSGCCITPSDCSVCPQPGNPAEVAAGIANLINADPDHIVTAQAFTVGMAGTFGAATTAGTIVVTVGTNVYSIPVAAGDTNATVAAKVAAGITGTTNSPYTAATTSTAGQVAAYAEATSGTPSGTMALTSAGGTGVTLTGVQANAKLNYTDPTTVPYGAGGGIRITANLTNAPSFNNNIPNKYFKGGTDFIVSFAGGLGLCNGTVTIVQNAVFPDGKAVDVKYLEYVAGGWNGNPGVYKTLNLTGLPKEDFVYYSVAGATYNMLVINNNIESVSGNMTTYLNPVATYIAIPCAESGTLTGIAAVLDNIYKGKFELTSDAAALPGSCVNPLTSAMVIGAKGIEFVA
jgi:hypothetical protein